MKCINCGKASTQLVSMGCFKICQTCANAKQQLSDRLKDDIEVEYTDGTKETLRSHNEQDIDLHQRAIDYVAEFYEISKDTAVRLFPDEVHAAVNLFEFDDNDKPPAKWKVSNLGH